jgi:alanine dehydrogenase
MTRLLTRTDVADLLPMDRCIDAVEQAFRLHGEGRAERPGILGVQARGDGFHIKAGILDLGRRYFAAKINANFPDNPARHGRPTIQGVLVLADAALGTPLAVMDAGEITTLRTGAATAVAARHLARPDAAVVTICGCGVQGRAQLRALAAVRPVRRAYAVDRDPARAAGFAREMAGRLGIEVLAVDDLDRAAAASDMCVTCTPSRAPLLRRGSVPPGAFVAAVGADDDHKQELDPLLMASSAVVVDVLEQAATIGDLHHAIAAGALAAPDVRAELGQVVAGLRAGRRSAGEVAIFDSTGMALQDVAAAAAVYEQAVTAGRGAEIDLAGSLSPS